VRVGGGVAGQLAIGEKPQGGSAKSPAGLEDLTVAPGVSPWVSGRVGIADNFEAGITYTGRTLRVDGRHAFELGPSTALSLGLGADAIIAQRPGTSTVTEGSSVYGGGLDLPILLGFRSASDLYSVWIGARGGVELIKGRLNIAPDPSGVGQFIDADGKHFQVGGLVGFRVGFRHVHVALELDGTFHRATGTLGDAKLALSLATLTPAGALDITF
jgi:hypothetical protein